MGVSDQRENTQENVLHSVVHIQCLRSWLFVIWRNWRTKKRTHCSIIRLAPFSNVEAGLTFTFLQLDDSDLIPTNLTSKIFPDIFNSNSRSCDTNPSNTWPSLSWVIVSFLKLAENWLILTAENIIAHVILSCRVIFVSNVVLCYLKKKIVILILNLNVSITTAITRIIFEYKTRCQWMVTILGQILKKIFLLVFNGLT